LLHIAAYWLILSLRGLASLSIEAELESLSAYPKLIVGQPKR